MIVDWSKVKRLFTFGCSFTCYMWPTWADIISKEVPNAEFYNFGLSGCGNTLISYRVAEANNRYKFNENDLVMVMYTSFTREDRWLPNGGWLARGNIFNQESNAYPNSWIKEFAHERFYLIRDAAVIELTENYLQSLPSMHYSMLSVPFVNNAEGYIETSTSPLDIRAVYEKTFNKFKPSLIELELRANFDELKNDYKFKDGHPSPIRYYNYMKKLGFNLSDKSENYAIEMSDVLRGIEVRNIVPVYFPAQDKNVSSSRTLLF